MGQGRADDVNNRALQVLVVVVLVVVAELAVMVVVVLGFCDGLAAARN